MNQLVDKLFAQQLSEWDLAKANYKALEKVLIKKLSIDGIDYKIQYNPARIVSSQAKIDKDSIAKRPCFLCENNLPEIQKRIIFHNRYNILVNPFPIFPKHLTIPDINHLPQSIESRIEDMLELSKALSGYTIFYNGPKCGASAPDHAHFQGALKGYMPIENDWKKYIGETILKYRKAILMQLDDSPRNTLIIKSSSLSDAVTLFKRLIHSVDSVNGEEPMMNILASYQDNEWTIFILLRSKHRPSCYFAEGNEKLLSSPASVDLGGLFITPLEKDFHRMDSSILRDILEEVCLSTNNIEQIKKRL